MTKDELIARLQVLGEQLNRDVSLTGTKEELALRVAELEGGDGEGRDHPHGEGHQCGPSVDGRRSQHGNSGNRHDRDACQHFGGERAEHHADRGIPAGRRNRQELPCGVCG